MNGPISNIPVTPAGKEAVRDILAERIDCIEQIVTEEIAPKDILDQRIARLEATIADIALVLLQNGVVIRGTATIKPNRLAADELLTTLFPDLSIPPEPKDIRPKKSDGLRDTSGRQITTTGKLVNQYARSGEKKSKED